MIQSSKRLGSSPLTPRPPIVITGGESTATSSVTMLVNSDPTAFILFEAPLTGYELSFAARDFVAAFPDARRLFTRYVAPTEAYEDLRVWLTELGYPYERVGVKLPTLDPWFLRSHHDADIIYCLRDIRTWLAQPRVVEYAGHDVVPVASAYLHQLILSCGSQRCFWMCTEDFARDHARVAGCLGDFLGLTLDAPEPWDATVRLPEGHPKTAIRYWPWHQSSLANDTGEDTTVRLKEHPFWDDFLPLFDRYYTGAALQHPPRDSIEGDLILLERIAHKYSVTLSDLYLRVEKRPVRPIPPPPKWRRVGYHFKRAVKELVSDKSVV